MQHASRLFPARRPLALVVLAFCFGPSTVSAQTPVAHGSAKLDRAAHADRVFFAPTHGTAYYDGFIVYYRNDTAPSDNRSKAAQVIRTRLDADLAHAGKVLGADARVGRRLATGGHLVQLEKRSLDRDEADRFMLELAANPDVRSVEPNLRLQASVLPNDTLLFAQWGLTEPAGGINVETAWGNASGNGVVIAVIDTGRTPHPDLDAKTLPGIDMIADPGNSRDSNGRDGDPLDQGDWNAAGECGEGAGERVSTWHGTHVAGIAAALTNNADGIAGVAYGSHLQHVRVLGTCGGTTADIADGIVWASGGAVPGVPTNPTPARVLNLSLGGLSACSTTYQAAIDSARSRNAVVIVAAGNDGVPAVQATPANCNGVVTVAANNRSGGRASYSNYGLAIDVAAPGGDGATSSADSILSTVNFGSDVPVPPPAGPGYDMKDGTSMAAPYVAGVAALMLSRNAALTPDQVETLLRNTSRPFPTVCSGGCGSGIVDATAAINAVNGATIAQMPLSVSLYGNGPGTVVSTPAGINCGTACSARFNSNGSVTLQATPAAGYEFGGWQGACIGVSATCVVTMQQARAVQAVFRAPLRVLANNVPAGNLASTGGTPLFFSFAVPAGATDMRFETSGGSGDVDLYVRFGAQPDAQTYDCRPFLTGNSETCALPQPAPGTYYAMLLGDPDFSGVTLRASYVVSGGGGTQRIFCDGMEATGQGCVVR